MIHIAKVNLIHRIKRFVIWLWRQEGSPAERARGIAVGVFSGCFPFFGFQTLIGIVLARLFKGNLLLASTATWISNPLTYIPLFWFNHKIGELFLGVSQNRNQLSQLSRADLFHNGLLFSGRILLGSSIVGFSLGLIFGLIFYWLFTRISLKRTTK